MPIEIVVLGIVKSVITAAIFIGLAFSPVGRALAQRMMHGRGAAVPADDPRVDDLVEDNQLLRRQLDEIHERLDFTERILAQIKDRGLLGSAKT
jgi:hypothetical protein